MFIFKKTALYLRFACQGTQTTSN